MPDGYVFAPLFWNFAWSGCPWTSAAATGFHRKIKGMSRWQVLTG